MSGYINYIRRVSKLQAPFQIPNPVIRPKRPTPDPQSTQTREMRLQNQKKKKERLHSVQCPSNSVGEKTNSEIICPIVQDRGEDRNLRTTMNSPAFYGHDDHDPCHDKGRCCDCEIENKHCVDVFSI